MLKETHARTLEAIKQHIQQIGYAPTISEILDTLQLKSRSLIQRHLKTLEEDGYIRLHPNRRRNIELMASKPQGLPLLGRIAAGQPMDAISDDDIIDIPNLLLADDRYLLEVKGDSMLGDNICDGDLVICRHSNTAAEGEIAVVLIDAESATLKRLHHDKEKGTIALIPSNPAFVPEEYAAERISIQGVYLGLLRLGNLRS